VRKTKDETVSSLDGTDWLGDVLDGVDGRRLQHAKLHNEKNTVSKQVRELKIKK